MSFNDHTKFQLSEPPARMLGDEDEDEDFATSLVATIPGHRICSAFDGSAPPTSISYRRSAALSARSFCPPSAAPIHTTYSLAGTGPSQTMPVIGEIPDLYDPDELILSECFFKDIILQTNCAGQYHSREDFQSYMLSHFNQYGPPERALCISCNLEFENKADPYSCWAEYLDHIRYQHFRNGMVLDLMRPDFVTWSYLRDIGALT